jgi:hypothetical protein
VCLCINEPVLGFEVEFYLRWRYESKSKVLGAAPPGGRSPNCAHVRSCFWFLIFTFVLAVECGGVAHTIEALLLVMHQHHARCRVLWPFAKSNGFILVSVPERLPGIGHCRVNAPASVDKCPRATHECGNHVHTCVYSYSVVDEIKQRNMVNSGVRGAKDKNLRSRCIGKLL